MCPHVHVHVRVDQKDVMMEVGREGEKGKCMSRHWEREKEGGGGRGGGGREGGRRRR